MTVLKSKDIRENVDLSTLDLEQEHTDEAKAASLLKKDISPDI